MKIAIKSVNHVVGNKSMSVSDSGPRSRSTSCSGSECWAKPNSEIECVSWVESGKGAWVTHCGVRRWMRIC